MLQNKADFKMGWEFPSRNKSDMLCFQRDNPPVKKDIACFKTG